MLSAACGVVVVHFSPPYLPAFRQLPTTQREAATATRAPARFLASNPNNWGCYEKMRV